MTSPCTAISYILVPRFSIYFYLYPPRLIYVLISSRVENTLDHTIDASFLCQHSSLALLPEQTNLL